MQRKELIFIVLIACMCSVQGMFAQPGKSNLHTMERTVSIQQGFYDFIVKQLDGQPFDMKQLRGKRVLIVNTASECGYTPQYAQLQELYEMYGGSKFIIIGFPSNDFGAQEPGSSADIATFCQINYGVTFPMMEKINILGDDVHPLYKWLTQQSLNHVSDAKVEWNFNKFLIDENGKWIAHYGSKTEPLDETIIRFASGEK